MTNRRKEISEEIKGFAPRLSSMGKPNCYQVPEAFFEQLAPSKIRSKGNDYAIPEGYFEEMQQEVLDKLSSPENLVRNRLYRKMIPWITSVAAAIVLFINVPRWMEGSDSQEHLETVYQQEEIMYLSDHLEDFDLEEIIYLVPDDSGSLDYLEAEQLEIYIQNNLEEFDLNDLESLL